MWVALNWDFNYGEFAIIKKEGVIMKKIQVNGTEIAVSQINNEDFICITDMLKAKDGDFFWTDTLIWTMYVRIKMSVFISNSKNKGFHDI